MIDRYIKAAYSGDMIGLQDCLNQGTEVDATDTKGRTALSYAAGAGSYSVVELLIMRGADVNLGTPTPLHAVKNAPSNSAEIAKLLLVHKADPNMQDEKEETPLHIAVKFNKLPLTKILLEYKADPSIKNHNGLTAMQVSGTGRINFAIFEEISKLLSEAEKSFIKDESPDRRAGPSNRGYLRLKKKAVY